MIELRLHSGRKEYIAASAIARISEAPTSSQWHGIRCYVRTTDGKTLECTDDAADVRQRVEAELNPPEKGD